MFDFFDELFGEIKHGNYRYQVDGGKQIVLQGYKNLLRAENEVVIVKLFDGEMKILGKNLHIKEFGTNSLTVAGEIQCVCVDEIKKTVKHKIDKQKGDAND